MNKLLRESIFSGPSEEDLKERLNESTYKVYEDIKASGINFDDVKYYVIVETSPDEDRVNIFHDKLSNVILEYLKSVMWVDQSPGERTANLGMLKNDGTGELVSGMGFSAPYVIYEYFV